MPRDNGGLIGASRTPGKSGVWSSEEQVIYQRIDAWRKDTYFSNVSLLLHMDGSNGSTTFTDSSANGLTVTAYGNAQISTASSKFGSASGLFDGNGDYLAIPGSAGEFSTNDFTIETWAYLTSNPASPGSVLFDTIPVGGNGGRVTGMVWLIDTNGKMTVFSNGQFRGTSNSAFPLNQWVHLALTRTGSTWRYFINGTLDTNSFTYSPNLTNNGGCIIGRTGDSASYYLNGRLDDFRLTKITSRYTTNFTPPDFPSPNA